jgi:hypothetical protein
MRIMAEELPPQVMTFARSMLDDALRNTTACPRPASVYGWWLQANTEGCAEESGYDLESIYHAFEDEGIYHLLGEPADGAFISMTPIENTGLGSSNLSLGQVVKKKRVPLAEGERIVRKVEKQLRPISKAVIPAGSVARKRLEIADIDFLVLPKNLRKFDQEIREMGFSGGGDMRIYKKLVDGIKVELYMAHAPEEMGSMIFMWLGDRILNLAQRSKAKKMGLKLNQYGLWKGNKPVLQSADERDFWDYLGMEYHTPEQRSLARRHDLQDMIRDLKEQDLTDKDRQFVEYAGKALRQEKYLEPNYERALENLFLDYFPKKKKKAETPEKHVMAGIFMGAEELIEMGVDEANDIPYFASFNDYAANFPEGERFREWLTQGGRREDILLIQGMGPNGSLPGGYIWAYVAEPWRGQPWTIYVGDNDDGLMVKRFGNQQEAEQDLKDLSAFAPVNMGDLTEFGYRWE